MVVSGVNCDWTNDDDIIMLVSAHQRNRREMQRMVTLPMLLLFLLLLRLVLPLGPRLWRWIIIRSNFRVIYRIINSVLSLCVRMINDDNDDVCAFVVVFVALVFVLDSKVRNNACRLWNSRRNAKKIAKESSNRDFDRFQFTQQQPPDNTTNESPQREVTIG